MRDERVLMVSLIVLLLVVTSVMYASVQAQHYYINLTSNKEALIQVKLYRFKDGSSKLVMKQKVGDYLEGVQEYVNGIKIDNDKIIAYGKIVGKDYVENEFGEDDSIFKLEIEASGSEKTVKIEKFYLYIEDMDNKETFKVELDGTITIKYNSSRVVAQGGTITIFSSSGVKDISQILKFISNNSEDFDITIEENTTNKLKFKINKIIIDVNDEIYSSLGIPSGESRQVADLISKIYLSEFKLKLDTAEGILTYKLEIRGDIANLISSYPLVKSSIVVPIGDYVITYDIAPTAREIWSHYKYDILYYKRLDIAVPTYAIAYYWPDNSTSLVAFPRVTLTNGSDTTAYLKNLLVRNGVPSNLVSVEDAESEEDLVKLPSELKGSWLSGDAVYVIAIAGILAGALAFLFIIYKKLS